MEKTLSDIEIEVAMERAACDGAELVVCEVSWNETVPVDRDVRGGWEVRANVTIYADDGPACWFVVGADGCILTDRDVDRDALLERAVETVRAWVPVGEDVHLHAEMRRAS